MNHHQDCTALTKETFKIFKNGLDEMERIAYEMRSAEKFQEYNDLEVVSMLIKNEVKLHPDSVKYINETLGQYTESKDTPFVIEDPVFHLYPVIDTFTEEGELIGFIDAVFFKLHIYDTKNMTVYKPKGIHDAIIPYNDIKVNQIKIFKDLSTLVHLRGKYELGYGTALTVELVE
jgi:hypothetical protein